MRKEAATIGLPTRKNIEKPTRKLKLLNLSPQHLLVPVRLLLHRLGLELGRQGLLQRGAQEVEGGCHVGGVQVGGADHEAQGVDADLVGVPGGIYIFLYKID